MNLIKQEDGYSFYENPDAQIKAAIQALPKPDYILYHRVKWFPNGFAKNGNRIMECEAGDVKSFTNEQYDDGLAEAHITSINSTFSVKDTFNKYFAPFKRGTEMIVEVTDKYLSFGRGFTGEVDMIYDRKEWSAYQGDSAYNNGTSTKRTSFKVSRGVRSGSLYFTADGDIANRDYNYNFNHKADFIPIENSLKKFYAYIKAYPDLEYANGRWFTADYALEIEIDDDRGNLELTVFQTPNQGTSYHIQGQSAYKFKKPKKTELVTSQHLLDAVKAAMEPYKALI